MSAKKRPNNATSCRKPKEHRNRHRHRRLAVESLEDRRLLAVIALGPTEDSNALQDLSVSHSNGSYHEYAGLSKGENEILFGLSADDEHHGDEHHDDEHHDDEPHDDEHDVDESRVAEFADDELYDDELYDDAYHGGEAHDGELAEHEFHNIETPDNEYDRLGDDRTHEGSGDGEDADVTGTLHDTGDDDPTFAAATTTKPFQNPRNPHDVDDTDGVTPLDALILINLLNTPSDELPLPSSSTSTWRYYDVSGDGDCSAIDVLMVVTVLNGEMNGAGEGEATRFASALAQTADTEEPDWNSGLLSDLSDSQGDHTDSALMPHSFEQPPESATYRPVADEAYPAIADDATRQITRPVRRINKDLPDVENERLDLDDVLSDIGQDIDKTWHSRE